MPSKETKLPSVNSGLAKCSSGSTAVRLEKNLMGAGFCASAGALSLRSLFESAWQHLLLAAVVAAEAAAEVEVLPGCLG